MSKSILGEGIVHLPPDAQVKYFADQYRRESNPAKVAWFKSRCDALGLHFVADELIVLAALDTPDRVQRFMNTQIYYNNDHAAVDQEETALPPRRILQTGLAHCFEGALFAYAVNYLHGHHPHLVLLESRQDSEHNLVAYRDPGTGLYGCNAHSAFPGLDGRPAEYRTLRAMAESYVPYYYSDRTRDPNDLTLVGYSEEFDLVAKYGTAWMASEAPLWDIYYTYIDDTWRLHYFSDGSGETHLYPVVCALKEKWIGIDAQGKPFVDVRNLPRAAQELWRAFWQLHGDNETYRRPRGEEAEIEDKFVRLTGTSPIDLDDNAYDLQFYLAAGYRIDQLLTKSS